MGASPLELPSLRFEPLYYRPHGCGDWSGHIPFAYDLVAAFRPSKIVELGTYYGESYFAFCQAVAECKVASQTFAVDSWGGDSHTGAYGEAVFREVSAQNQKHYAAFSTLLRESFDNAVQHFAESSIDVLHIDGLHTYDAVRHDFERWLPKVSQGGLILFHDTQIRSDSFGVWRLWQELREGYDSFEFVHSCGLGVIRKPGAAPTSTLPDLAGLLFRDREKAEAVRRFYRICGERLEYRDRFERLRRRGKWEILAKLFWRQPGQEFSQERSVQGRDEITTCPQKIRLELPGSLRLDQLRFDLLECPPFLRLHGIRLLGTDGALLWSMPGNQAQDLLPCVGVHLTPEDNGCSLAARISGEEASFILNLPQAILGHLAMGAEFEVELAGLETEDYSMVLNSLLQQALKSTAAVECRVAALQVEANILARSLAGAQELVEQQRSEGTALTRGLAEAQDLVRKKDLELLLYDQALAQAQNLAVTRERELNELHGRHGEALDTLRRTEESLASQTARVHELSGLLAETRKELAGREEQLCNSTMRLSALQRQAATRERD